MDIELPQTGRPIKAGALSIEVPEQIQSAGQARGHESLGECQFGDLESLPPWRPGPLLMIELELGVRPIRGRVERRCFDEPGLAMRTHLAGELAGDDPPGVVHQAL